jgi:hypothetical protein
VIEGPACVGITSNVLRYSAEFGRTITFTAGPNLSAGLEPPAATVAAVPAVSKGTELDPIRAALKTAHAEFLANDRLNTVSAGKLTAAVTGLKTLVSSSDDLFRGNGPDGVLKAVQDPQTKADLAAGANANWIGLDNLASTIKQIQATIADALLGNPSDADKAALTAMQTDAAGLLTDISPSLMSGDKTASFYKQKALIVFWSRVINGLTPDSFVMTTYVSCGVLFNQNKQTAIKLLQYDRLPLFDNQQITAVDVKDPFVTVNCASPFTISAGVEFRFLANNTFGLVPSGSSGTNVFGITDESKTAPLPIGMVHTRLLETANHKIALHASFGAAAHVQSSSSGGSGAEFLTGLSVSLLRTMYITPGWHIGKVAYLAGGYKVGDTVPAGVTTAPVESKYEHGFGLAITFTKP